jgi:glycosyltransferase involved in cell wall biosynthesis
LKLRSVWSRPRTFRPAGHKDALFVFESPGPWTRYRCDHQAEQLAICGGTSDVVQADRLRLADAVDHYDVFVLYRVGWSNDVEGLVEAAAAGRKTVVFETDDLVFEPELTHHLAFLASWSDEERAGQVARFAAYRRTLEACGRAIVSTEPLAWFAERHVEEVDVLANAVSHDMIERADAVLASTSRRRSAKDVTIAYLSGTRTHDRDFLEAADAVLWALDTYPDVRFVAAGKLQLDERFDEWGSRVERVPLRPFEALPDLLATVDINLAPLEPDNPIAACKSCAKYLEGGLLRVPTIASPRPDFSRVIEHGVNGLLAETPAEWRDAVRRLIDAADERRELGAAAHADVRANHTTAARATSFAAALERG